MRAACLVAALMLAALARPDPAAATVLGRMNASVAGHDLAYRITDAPGAGSAWQGARKVVTVTLDWHGPLPTDRLVLELTLNDGRPVAARLEQPDALGGALSADAPDGLKVTLRQALRQGSWLHLKGRLSGRLQPAGAKSGALEGGSKRIRAWFSTWVPAILAPEPSGSSEGGHG
ncbi:hypothetical protein [Acidimangrovimonas pyrenivorans]|uniref:Uncharacterized protein n=1 Tax=Acidimangrovimonas pyrenivorans TaxID=2030798 RepID=A0ABV7AJD2_9RHOB